MILLISIIVNNSNNNKLTTNNLCWFENDVNSHSDLTYIYYWNYIAKAMNIYEI